MSKGTKNLFESIGESDRLMTGARIPKLLVLKGGNVAPSVRASIVSNGHGYDRSMWSTTRVLTR